MHDPLPESDFHQSLREPLLRYHVYEENFSGQLETFEHVRERLQQPPEKISEIPLYNLMNATQRMATDASGFLVNCYSGGHDIAQLQAFYDRAVEYWQTYAHYNQAYNDSNERETPWPHVALAGPDYHHALAMVCFGILLGKREALHRLVPLIDYRNEKRDALVERLLSSCVDGREPATNMCRRNLPYSKSLAVFSALPEERPALMAQYLADWYQSSRREDYYDLHKSGYQFVGYWSWEAAAITLVLDIDDTSYRDLPYYPKDMVDFARQANAGKMPRYTPPAVMAAGELPVPFSAAELVPYWQHKKLSPSDFEQVRRSGRMRYESYEENLEYSALKTFHESAGRDDFDGASGLAWESVNHMRNAYSAGHALEDLHTFFPLALSFWESYGRFLTPFTQVEHGEDDDYRKEIWLDLGDDDYHTGLSLVCFAILLGHQDKLARIMPILDYGNRRRDALLERLVAPWVPGRDAPPKKCTRGKPYSQLLPLFTSPAEKRSGLMVEYLRAWYDLSENEPYFGTNKKGMQYFGYWSFEAAAAAFVLGIDDASCRADRFYPGDLVDFARSRAAMT
jgi:hypothetical protein